MMMRVQVWYFAGILFAAAAARADCFRSVGEAATQTGVREELGYRLAGVSRDVFGGRRWAEVRSCKHPERPSVLVALEDGRPAGEAHPNEDTAVVRMGHADGRHWEVLVRAGSRVTLVSAEAMVRMEVMGVAVESGAAGERVRVRLVTEGQAGERIAWGVVRTAELVEMVH